MSVEAGTIQNRYWFSIYDSCSFGGIKLIIPRSFSPEWSLQTYDPTKKMSFQSPKQLYIFPTITGWVPMFFSNSNRLFHVINILHKSSLVSQSGCKSTHVTPFMQGGYQETGVGVGYNQMVRWRREEIQEILGTVMPDVFKKVAGVCGEERAKCLS